MADQNYGNHPRYVPMFHFVVLPLLLFTFIGSIVNLIQSLGDHERLYSAALILRPRFAPAPRLNKHNVSSNRSPSMIWSIL